MAKWTKADIIAARDKALAVLPADAPYAVISRANELLGAHGIDSVYQGNDKPSCMYVNTGDAYACTLIYDEWRERFIVQSWGDWLETQDLDGHEYN